MSNPINSIVARFNVVNRQKFLAKSLMIAFALFGTFLLSGEAKAQGYQQRAQSYQQFETQVQLNLAQICLQKGNDYCALNALKTAAMISPQLAYNRSLVQLAQILQARIDASGYYQTAPSGSNYWPRRESTLIEKGFTFGNAFLGNK